MIIHWVGIGEVKSASAGERLGCILGSCVSTVLWQPERQFAVMNHILLPRPGRHRRDQHPDGRFAADAWRMMQTRLTRHGIRLHECVAFLAGGGRVLEAIRNDIGAQNIASMLDLLETAEVPLQSIHAGGDGHRTARFNPANGEFRVTHAEPPYPQLAGQSINPSYKIA